MLIPHFFAIHTFPKLYEGRHLDQPGACQFCNLNSPFPECKKGQKFWREMKAVLTRVRYDPSFYQQSYEQRAKTWETFNANANAYLLHLGATTHPYAYDRLPTGDQQRQYCTVCQQSTIWLRYLNYHTGTSRFLCGPCQERDERERAALVWKLEYGKTPENAWIFTQVRQWITEDGWSYMHIDHGIEGWQMGFDPQTEPEWKHCSEAYGIMLADARDPYLGTSK